MVEKEMRGRRALCRLDLLGHVEQMDDLSRGFGNGGSNWRGIAEWTTWIDRAFVRRSQGWPGEKREEKGEVKGGGTSEGGGKSEGSYLIRFKTPKD
jgi:hypothetical protein